MDEMIADDPARCEPLPTSVLLNFPYAIPRF